jgi:putative endonuclease
VSTEKRFFVYIMASRPWGTLYVGVTSDLFQRVFQHREGLVEGFTNTYGIKALVYFEEWPTGHEASHREKRLKKWPRVWKINLFRTDNPDWNDLAARWYPKRMTAADLDKWLVGIAESTR